jgi:hypothetical protein
VDGPGQVHGTYGGRVLRHSVVTELVTHVPRPGDILTGALATLQRQRAGNGQGARSAAP